MNIKLAKINVSMVFIIVYLMTSFDFDAYSDTHFVWSWVEAQLVTNWY